ncbi:MAG: hypothetical protein KIT84_31735 [Labilithrix sp.]|nr:hypothetical protein [Labilithrix sp.]MCW5815642.1 hypothetical protein [Labilithrix sp.]
MSTSKASTMRFTTLVAVGATTAAAATAMLGACLSDLAPFIPADAGADTRTTPPPAAATGCGDGIIATLDDGGDAGESCDPGAGAAPGCTPRCTLSCGGVLGPSGHCYFLADPGDHAAAVEHCARAGGHLVTIGDAEEAKLVDAFVDGGSYRVGLSVSPAANAYVAESVPRVGGSGVPEPGWPRGDDRCAGCFAIVDAGPDGSNITFPPADPDAGDRSCVVARGGVWLEVPCSGASDALTVCEREPAGQRTQYCGGPYCTTLPATSGRKRYVISLEPATAAAASELCRGYDAGRLVVLESPAERAQLAREIVLLARDRDLETNDVWIGLAREDDGWRWDDGVPADDAGAGRPRPWANNEPRPDATGRAFLRLTTFFDTQLVATSPAADAETKLFVCERR